MKNSEIKKYWKEERDAKTTMHIHLVGSHRSSSAAPNLSTIPKHVDESYVEHKGGTVQSKTAYMMKCMPCGNRSFK